MEHSTEYDIKSQHMTPFEELLAERGGPPAYVAPPAPSAPYRTPDFRSMQNENAYLLGHAKTQSEQLAAAAAQLQNNSTALQMLQAENAVLRGERDERSSALGRAAEKVSALKRQNETGAREHERLSQEVASLREQLSDARKREIEATRGQERARTELADASERAGELKVALDQSRSEVPPLRDALEAEKRKCETLEADAATGRAQLAAVREALERLRGDYNQLSRHHEEARLLLQSAAATRDAMADQIKRDQGEAAAAQANAQQSGAMLLAEKEARLRAEQVAFALREAADASEAQRHWLAGQLRSGEARLSRAEKKSGIAEAESQQLALRLGLFQRMVSSDAKVQYLVGTRGRRDATLSKALQREQSARQMAWDRIHEIAATSGP